MDSIRYGSKEINFEIRRVKRRKTVTIRLNPSRIVSVLAPEGADEERIRAIVRKRARWIAERQDSVRGLNVLDKAKEFVSGETLPYLGRGYRLKVVRAGVGQNGRCELVAGRLLVEVAPGLNREGQKELVKRRIVSWYLERADEKIRDRVDYYSRQVGVKPKGIEIKEQEKRWGSCSKGGMVRFNWKIVFAPLSVLDYVIVHELCHLLYPDHSEQFWQKIQSCIPDYKKKRKWLKEFTPQSTIF
jgi:predicted metal-dependent hydrolase